MIDLAAEVAQAAASGAAGRLASGGMEAAVRLVSALRAKFRSDARARDALEAMVDQPNDVAACGDLESLLRERTRGDAGFAAWLEALWDEAAPDVNADGGSTNIVHGAVHGDVIQARDVHGGIHIGRRTDEG